MHYAYKVERVRHMLAGTLADGHHGYRRRPFHIVTIGIACAPTACITIKGKNTVQSRYMRGCKRSCEGENIHICARREVRVYNVEALLFDTVHSFVQMIIGFEMHRPRHTRFNQRPGEKGNQHCRCFCITGREQCHIMALSYLFLNKMIYNILCSPILLWRNADPRWSNLCDSHVRL